MLKDYVDVPLRALLLLRRRQLLVAWSIDANALD
jgi:hypothetical protein